MTTLEDKMKEVLEHVGRDAQRFGILALTLATSSNQPEDPDEFMRLVLDMTQKRLDEVRTEFTDAVKSWNNAAKVVP